MASPAAALKSLTYEIIDPMASCIKTPTLCFGCSMLGFGAVTGIALYALGFGALAITAGMAIPVSIGLLSLGVYAAFTLTLSYFVDKIVKIVDDLLGVCAGYAKNALAKD